MKYTVTHLVIFLGAELHEHRVHILVDGVTHYAECKREYCGYNRNDQAQKRWEGIWLGESEEGKNGNPRQNTSGAAG